MPADNLTDYIQQSKRHHQLGKAPTTESMGSFMSSLSCFRDEDIGKQEKEERQRERQYNHDYQRQENPKSSTPMGSFMSSVVCFGNSDKRKEEKEDRQFERQRNQELQRAYEERLRQKSPNGLLKLELELNQGDIFRRRRYSFTAANPGEFYNKHNHTIGTDHWKGYKPYEGT